MESQWLPVSLVVWITALAGTLDARQQARFVQLCTGLLFARGRRTVTSWLRGCGTGSQTDTRYGSSCVSGGYSKMHERRGIIPSLEPGFGGWFLTN